MANLPVKRKKSNSAKQRLAKKRNLVPAELSSETSPSTLANGNETLSESQPERFQLKSCINGTKWCGLEAACIEEGDSIKCVCPHDKSAPTKDLKCTNRAVVSPEPKTIQIMVPPRVPPRFKIASSTVTLPEAEQVEPLKSIAKVPEIVGIAVGCLLMLSVIVVIVFRCRNRCWNSETKRKSPSASPINLKKSLLMTNKYTPNPQYYTCASTIPILLRDEISLLEDIGEGCFGKVHKGERRHNGNTEIVAVKVLKETASREAEEDFMREVDIMSSFKHKNILTLIGVVLRDCGNNPCMVFEYMPYGDLTNVLRNNSPQRNSIPGLKPLTKDDLHYISCQIAAGMTYLSTQRFVHRDLACRNCLVGSELVVKIADFGMSRDVYTCDYYKIGGSRLLPVRWMSPESVMYGRFTLESDVWSFGVVLWEIYSYGKQPYYGHNNEEVVKLILQGIMLIPPEDCPLYICQIMRDCWKSEPRDRFKFCDILERLEKNSIIGSLPRPPQGPITIRTPDMLDSAGYLLPAPAIPCEYLQPLPSLPD